MASVPVTEQLIRIVWEFCEVGVAVTYATPTEMLMFASGVPEALQANAPVAGATPEVLVKVPTTPSDTKSVATPFTSSEEVG